MVVVEDGGRGLRPGLFAPVRVDETGRAGPTSRGARGQRWRRTSRGLYVPATVARSLAQRIVEAAAVLPEHGGVTGWAGLSWHGATWFDGTGAGRLERPVCLVTAGDDIRSQPGIAISAERLDPRDLVTVAGVRTTTPVRSVWFEMRYAESPRRAVAIFGMAAYADLASVDELAEFVHQHPGWTGAPQVRWACAHAVENSWSPQEDMTRLVWELDAGLPRLHCNIPLFDRNGRHLGTPDLLDVESGTVIEYDGSLHLTHARRRRDIRREEKFRRHGLEYLTVTSGDLRNELALASRMHAVRRRARFTAEGRRGWTVEPPRWWVPTHTVEQRRALDPDLRNQLLGYRAA